MQSNEDEELFLIAYHLKSSNWDEWRNRSRQYFIDIVREYPMDVNLQFVHWNVAARISGDQDDILALRMRHDDLVYPEGDRNTLLTGTGWWTCTSAIYDPSQECMDGELPLKS